MPITTTFSYFEKNSFLPRQIKPSVDSDLNTVVVIPCHNEPDLLSSLIALRECEIPKNPVEVITVINSGVQHDEGIRKQNNLTEKIAREWAKENHSNHIRFHILHVTDLPKKSAGVGLARKIGMDEAAIRLSETKSGRGIIVCFDADSSCDGNYLVEIEKAFEENPKAPGASIYYEHPLENGDEIVDSGILRYEIYLRYYVQALRWTGYPFAFHTIGSSMAVRSEIYCAVGGMNRKKAGEDFYFLHKLIPRGDFLEINSTRVIPSARTSDRVPFGTGKAMAAWRENPDKDYPVYDFQSFIDFKALVTFIESQLYQIEKERLPDSLANLPKSVRDYLELNGFSQKVMECHQHSTSPKPFKKRVYAFVDGLFVLKYFHFARDNFYPNRILSDNCLRYLSTSGIRKNTEVNYEAILNILRDLDKGGIQAT